MWKFALVWIGAVILFFVLWALAAKFIRRISEKKSEEEFSGPPQETRTDEQANQ